VKPWPTIFIACLLTGCAHFESKPLAPEKSAAQLDARRLDDAELKKFVENNSGGESKNWPPAKWDLNSLTLAAFYFHPDLAVARAQWRVAEAGVKTAGGRPNPTVSAGPGYNFSAAAGINPWMPFGSVDLPIETAGKRGKRIAEAEKISESARWDYVSTAWQIRSGVRAALLDFSAAQKRAKLLQKQCATQNEIFRRLEQRFAAGAIDRSELVPAQMALNKMQLELSGAQSKLADARSRLAQALGLPLAALDGIQFETDFSPANLKVLNSADARRAALLGRSDIRAALADYAAAEENLKLEIAKQYPDLHLNPGYQFDQGDNKWTFGFTVELPVLNQNQGPIAESKARRELAAAKFLQLQSQVIGAIDRAVAGLDAVRTQLKTGSALLDMAARQQKSVAAQIKAGAAEQMDLLNAEMEFNSVRLAQLDSEAQLQSAIGALEDALQRPADDFDALKFLPAKSQP
jgi:outer membrane protein TolC